VWPKNKEEFLILDRPKDILLSKMIGHCVTFINNILMGIMGYIE